MQMMVMVMVMIRMARKTSQLVKMWKRRLRQRRTMTDLSQMLVVMKMKMC